MSVKNIQSPGRYILRLSGRIIDVSFLGNQLCIIRTKKNCNLVYFALIYVKTFKEGAKGFAMP